MANVRQVMYNATARWEGVTVLGRLRLGQNGGIVGEPLWISLSMYSQILQCPLVRFA